MPTRPPADSSAEEETAVRAHDRAAWPADRVTSRILFVDDEFNVLAAIRRQLHKRFEIEIARGGEDALSRLTTPDRFAVIVSDLRMPGVDGLGLLARSRQIAPDVVRIVLTGQVDTRAALSAINECAVYRFLLKPCEAEALGDALDEALACHHRSMTDRELIGKSRTGTINFIAEALSLANPPAHERSKRLRRYARHVIKQLGLNDDGTVELAAGLSQIGYLAVPTDVLERHEHGRELSAADREALDKVPEYSQRLLSHVPGLAAAAAIAAAQAPGMRIGPANDVVGLGSRLLRVVTAFDEIVSTGAPVQSAIDRLHLDPDAYPRNMVDALTTVHANKPGAAWLIGASKLKPGMIAEEDIRTKDGVLLASRSQEITPQVLERILQASGRLAEPFRVRVPAAQVV